MNRLRLLVVAHDFPPVRSPQSVRAQELLSALAVAGWDIVVITRRASRDVVDEWPFLVVRVSPGWFEACVDMLGRRRRASVQAFDAATSSPSLSVVVQPPVLNWKGRIIQKARRCLARVLFPDATVLWVRHAEHAIEKLLPRWRPDIALLMHEPPSSLCVSRVLTRRNIPWVADLADPVLAPYTMPWWRRPALRLERRVLASAASITVTNASTAELLRARHSAESFGVTVVRQGFAVGAGAPPDDGPGRLRLLYTGRFYSFRRPDALLAAMEEVGDVVLTIAGPEMPASVLEAAARSNGRIILAGDLPYAEAKALQEHADVLVCVANADTVQVPGKFFEYLGASRPILHLQASPDDELAVILAELRRGEAAMNERKAIVAALRVLSAAKARGLAVAYDLSIEAVRSYSWEASAASMGDALKRAVRR